MVTQVAVAAILVNYNAGTELTRALQSLVEDLSSMAWEGVVVDNASSDGSVSAAEAFAPRVRIVRNTQNCGFGRAVNQAVAVTSAPYLLIMNPDCRLATGATRALVQVLEQDERCAIAGPRILDPDGRLQGSARGDPDMLTGLFGRTALFRRLLPSSAAAQRNVVPEAALGSAGSISVDWVSGACMLVRRIPFEAVGGFDEHYFLYWEDADLCRRLRQAGYTIRYTHAATAIHQVGRSSRTAPTASIRAFHASAYRYYTTHVAPHAADPRRVLARAVLSARCWWRLRAAAAVDARQSK